MSNHLDPDRSIARWLVAEAPDHAPERLLEASRAQVRSTAQRRSLRLVRRIQAMNSYAKLAIAAAAVLVVAVVGINLGPGLNTISSEASPSKLASGFADRFAIGGSIQGGGPAATRRVHRNPCLRPAGPKRRRRRRWTWARMGWCSPGTAKERGSRR